MRSSLDANEHFFADHPLYDSLNSLNNQLTFQNPQNFQSISNFQRVSHQQIQDYYDTEEHDQQPSPLQLQQYSFNLKENPRGIQDELYRQIQQQQAQFKIQYNPNYQRTNPYRASNSSFHDYSQIIERKETTNDSNYGQQDISPERISVKPQQKDIKPQCSNKNQTNYNKQLKKQVAKIDISILQEKQKPINKVIPKIDSQSTFFEKENSSPTNLQHQNYLNYLMLLKKDQKNKQELPIFPEVDYQTKQQLITWLLNINLIKSSIQSSVQLIEKLSKLAKSGVFFCDLINRLNGKISEPLKGINRKPNDRQYGHNWYKVFEFLRKTERMNPRYLYCEDIYTSDNQIYENAFWCLLSDTYNAFTAKNAPKQEQLTKRASSQHFSGVGSQQSNSVVQTKRNSVNSQQQDNSRNEASTNNSRYTSKMHTEQVQDIRQSKQFQPTPLIKNIPKPVQYQALHQPSFQTKNQMDSYSPLKKITPKQTLHTQNSGSKSPMRISKTVPLQKASNSLINLGNARIVKINQVQERELQQWLSMMISFDKIQQGQSLFDDPYRNGLVVCRLLIKLGFLRSSNIITHKPKNISECQDNWNEALSVFNFVDLQYKKIILEKFLQGCKSTFYSIIHQIKDFYNEWSEQNQNQAIKSQVQKNEIEFQIEDNCISIKGGQSSKLRQKSSKVTTNQKKGLR